MVHCRVSRSVEVPSGTPSVVYTAKEHPTRAAAVAAAVGISRARTTMEECHQYVPIVRGFLVVTPRRTLLFQLLFARRRPDVMRLHVTASKVHVDSFHVNNVKMSIDTRAYGAEKFTWIMTRRYRRRA